MRSKEDEYLERVSNGRMRLEDVPSDMRSDKICLAALKKNELALEFVEPNRVSNYDAICLVAVKRNASALKFVKPNSVSNFDEICLEVVKEDASALRFVNSNSVSNYGAICLEAMKRDGLALRLVKPESVSNYNEICLGAVKRDGLALQFVKPKSVSNYDEICIGAVKQDGSALQFVDRSVCSNYNAICLEAVKRDGAALDLVEPNRVSNYDEICLEAVKRHGSALEFVKPNSVSNYDAICLEAVKQDGPALQFVDKRVCSNYDAICLEAVKRSLPEFYNIPDEFSNDNRYLITLAALAALKDGELDVLSYAKSSPKYGETIKDVEQNLMAKYDEICSEVVQKYWRALQVVDGSQCSNYGELCLAAVNQDLSALRFVDRSVCSNYEEIWNLAAEKLCAENKNTELLIINHEGPDSDLSGVIGMREDICRAKGNKLVVMKFDDFDKMMKDVQVKGITKLSFLHHGANEFGYKENISGYINHLPDLSKIVLRGCGTAKIPKEAPVKGAPVYEIKKTKGYDEKASVQGDNQLVIQQKVEDGKTLTKVSWKTEEGIQELAGIDTVSLINLDKKDKKNKKYEKITDAQITALELIEGMPLLKHSAGYVTSLKNTFFDPTKAISKEDLIKTKKAVRRARTEQVSTQDDLLSEILSEMTPDQKAKISVKAYVGAYAVDQGRVIPGTSHGYDNEPKAVRIGPKH